MRITTILLNIFRSNTLNKKVISKITQTIKLLILLLGLSMLSILKMKTVILMKKNQLRAVSS